MPLDTNLRTAADNLIRRFGDNAMAHAAIMATDAVEHADIFATQSWKRIGKAVKQRLDERVAA